MQEHSESVSSDMAKDLRGPSMPLLYRWFFLFLAPCSAYMAYSLMAKIVESAPEALFSIALAIATYAVFWIALGAGWFVVCCIHVFIQRTVIGRDAIAKTGLWRQSCRWDDIGDVQSLIVKQSIPTLVVWDKQGRRFEFSAGNKALREAFSRLADIYGRRARTLEPDAPPLRLTTRFGVLQRLTFLAFLSFGLLMLAMGGFMLWYAFQGVIPRHFWGRLVYGAIALGMGGLMTWAFLRSLWRIVGVSHVELSPPRLTVHWKKGRQDVFELPRHVETIQFTGIGEVNLTIKNGDSYYGFSNTEFHQPQPLVNQYLNAAIPCVLIDADGRIVETSNFIGLPPPQGLMKVIGTLDGIYDKATGRYLRGS